MIGAGVSDEAWAEVLTARAETDEALARLLALQAGERRIR